MMKRKYMVPSGETLLTEATTPIATSPSRLTIDNSPRTGVEADVKSGAAQSYVQWDSWDK